MSAFNSTRQVAVAFGILAATFGASVSGANAAGSAKEFFVQDYQFSKPMHGFSGYSNNYYCDYQRLPNRKCTINANGTESCRIVGWTLREMCQ